MNSKHLLWEPAIYEHKAALINQSVWAVARSADLLTEAVLTEHDVYQADLLTVGVDVYNLEAEACGARLHQTGPGSCPDIAEPPFNLGNLPNELDPPAIPQAGRFDVMIEAGARVRQAIGNSCSIRVAASGPCSIAAKLVGLQELIVSLAMGEDSATKILSFAGTLTEQWCRCLRGAGLDVIVFDSVVAPPMLSPAMYHQTILPLHKKIMSLLADLGQTDRPLIIGGQTTPIVSDLVNSGATMIICDFTENANTFAAALGSDTTIQVRRNVNPQILFGDDDKLLNSARQLAADLALFSRPIAGTGILSYDSNPLKLQVFHDLLGKCVG